MKTPALFALTLLTLTACGTEADLALEPGDPTAEQAMSDAQDPVTTVTVRVDGYAEKLGSPTGLMAGEILDGSGKSIMLIVPVELWAAAVGSNPLPIKLKVTYTPGTHGNGAEGTVTAVTATR